MVKIGDLITSELFEGTGKVYLIDEVDKSAEISFFESPNEANSRRITIPLFEVTPASIKEESLVFYLESSTGHWKRARYGGERPSNQHLIIYRAKEHEVVDSHNLYVLNLRKGSFIDSKCFLAEKVTDSPHFYNWRSNFLNAYIEQRESCHSISSIINSGIDLEPHQIAVVKKVLQDDIKKYLLADEVGLGKTIEAGMIVKEYLSIDPKCKAVVIAPSPLVEQWKEELCDRLLLSDYIDSNLIVCSHSEAKKQLPAINPDVIVIDEAHLISPLAWSSKFEDYDTYKQISHFTESSEVCLLLSGTPVTGNEKNFLSMLHLLSPESYEISEAGLSSFKNKVEQREYLGGIYTALNPRNDNSSIEDCLEGLEERFPNDQVLIGFINELKPKVDFFADEDEPDRAKFILNLQSFIGENYKLHHRLLRSRRDEPHIACLFPGLNENIKPIIWETEDSWLSIEQSLESYRDNHISNCENNNIINSKNYWHWLEAALISPLYFKSKLQQAMDSHTGQISDTEFEEFRYFQEVANKEQVKKDTALLHQIKSWLKDNPLGQIVLFAGAEYVADHLFKFLSERQNYALERHSINKIANFITDKNIKVLVCDLNGEDGLNLHGGKKLLIHYSLPLSITRIEQRIGRANRYTSSHAKPIENTVILPDTKTFSNSWFSLLKNGIGVFKSSVASLQYIIENRLSSLPELIVKHGNQALYDLEKEFIGENGWITQERKRIKAQEQLNSMDQLIQSANEFTERVLESDEKAEEQTALLDSWITDGLHFKKIKGEIEGTFKYKYVANKTLMDVKSFIGNCLSGIDFDNSSYGEPLTHLMAYDRSITATGKKIYPYRYGQPFLDTIYQALTDDIRGISSAHIRSLKGIAKPAACFCLEILVQHEKSKVSLELQRLFDEKLPPRIYKVWVNESGKLIKENQLVSYLEQPYVPFDKKIDSKYKDINLRAERWQLIEDYYPNNFWSELVEQSYSSAFNYLKTEVVLNDEAELKVISTKAVILMELGNLL